MQHFWAILLAMAAKEPSKAGEANYLLWLSIALLLLIPVFSRLTGPKTKTTLAMFTTINDQIKMTYADITPQQYGWNASTHGLTGLTANGVDFKISPLLNPTTYYIQSDSSSPINSGGWKFSRHLIQPSGNVDKVINLILPLMRQQGFAIDQSTPFIHFAKIDHACDYSHQENVSTLSCYTQEDTNAAAAQVKFMVGGYKLANQTDAVGDMTFGPMVVKSQNGSGVINSTHVAGFDIAEAINTVRGTPYYVIYYRKGQGPWLYISKATDEKSFPCSDFQITEEVRKVLNDQVCVSDHGLVRLDTTHPATTE
jgi:hypothetical protein